MTTDALVGRCHPETHSYGARSRLSHRIEMHTMGWAVVTWPIVLRPLHEALLEDALDRVERQVGMNPRPRDWSPWVELLRRMPAGRR